jgi:two-component system NtrC family sensor kinase
MDRSHDHIEMNGAMERDLLEQMAFNEKMAELGMLATGLVHELNTPLSVIVSAAQMVLREEELSGFAREMIERIGLEANRLSQFSRGLLSFTRRNDDGEQEVNPAEVLRDVTAFLRYEAQKRSIRVVEDLDYRTPFVSADPNHLKQICINLIMNAFQAMNDGGTLLLRSTTGSGGCAELEIADTGPGIPAETLEHIFMPFYTTKAPGEGTGLGLFITRKIVELYNGTIAVKSTPGQGTTFHISLPACPSSVLDA